MTTELHWIDGPWLGQVAISSRPRGGDWLEDEVHSWDQLGVDIAVSLLTKDETVDLRLTRTASLWKPSGPLVLRIEELDLMYTFYKHTARTVTSCDSLQSRN